jgi:hypothetical protein
MASYKQNTLASMSALEALFYGTGDHASNQRLAPYSV